MKSLSPELGPVLRGDRAGAVTSARFDVDLRERPGAPSDLTDRWRAEAHAAGYAAGWAHGIREAEVAVGAARDQELAQSHQAAAELAVRTGRALAALATATAGLEQRMAPSVPDLAEAAVDTAFALAQSILGRELAVAEEPGRDAMLRALMLAPAGRPVTVRLAPADHALLSTPDGRYEIDGRTVTLLADPALRSGDSIAECDATTIDARLATALERVREVLAL
jgi:flagellar assembly protein FliH